MSMASESESPTDAWARLCKAQSGSFKLGVSYCVCRIRVRARTNQSNRSLVGGVGEPEWAKSPVGDVCTWAGLRLEC